MHLSVFHLFRIFSDTAISADLQMSDATDRASIFAYLRKAAEGCFPGSDFSTEEKYIESLEKIVELRGIGVVERMFEVFYENTYHLFIELVREYGKRETPLGFLMHNGKEMPLFYQIRRWARFMFEGVDSADPAEFMRNLARDIEANGMVKMENSGGMLTLQQSNELVRLAQSWVPESPLARMGTYGQMGNTGLFEEFRALAVRMYPDFYFHKSAIMFMHSINKIAEGYGLYTIERFAETLDEPQRDEFLRLVHEYNPTSLLGRELAESLAREKTLFEQLQRVASEHFPDSNFRDEKTLVDSIGELVGTYSRPDEESVHRVEEFFAALTDPLLTELVNLAKNRRPSAFINYGERVISYCIRPLEERGLIGEVLYLESERYGDRDIDPSDACNLAMLILPDGDTLRFPQLSSDQFAGMLVKHPDMVERIGQAIVDAAKDPRAIRLLRADEPIHYCFNTIRDIVRNPEAFSQTERAPAEEVVGGLALFEKALQEKIDPAIGRERVNLMRHHQQLLWIIRMCR